MPLNARVRAEVTRGAQDHGGVAVVTASVHQARVAAGVRQAGFLGNRQRIHVGAYGHRTGARTRRE